MKRICKFEGCGAERVCGTYCPGHHWQFKKGRPLTPIARMDSSQRFWSYVTRTDSCWEWSGPKNQDGYAKFSADGKKVFAHRFAYKLLTGELPDGSELDHSCRVRSCVNPEHLRIVTRKENVENVDVFRNSTTGVRGVGPVPGGKYRARVAHNGKVHYLGLFATIEEADAVAVAKRLELHTNNLLDRKAS